MQMDSLGKMLPAIVFPYVQQWAERSGLPLLSQLLVDEQFQALFARYGDEMMRRMGQDSHSHATGSDRAHGNGIARGNGKQPAPRSEPLLDEADSNTSDLADLQDHELAMQVQREAPQALFELLRSRIRPLALALGCCPECLVGVEGCPTCSGQSRVAYYPPDYALLEAEIVSRLAARGVPLVLNARAEESTATKMRSKPCRKK